jgi:hypothetical protein
MQVFPARLRLRHRVAEKEKTYTRNWWRGKNVRACNTPAYLSQLVTSVYGYWVLWMTNTHKDSSRPKQTSSRKLKRWSFTAFWRDSMWQSTTSIISASKAPTTHSLKICYAITSRSIRSALHRNLHFPMSTTVEFSTLHWYVCHFQASPIILPTFNINFYIALFGW